MTKEHVNVINCSTFEDLLTDYLDKTLDAPTHKAVAAHALICPLCHSLLNEVKDSIAACKTIAAPHNNVTRLEARVLSMTMPETAMSCEDFECYLTDYLDGFLPAQLFHRWERHAALCGTCEDLPGMVVRSIAACYTYKMDELAVPAGLHQRILNLTIGAEKPKAAKSSIGSRMREWLGDIRLPVSVPQLAPVAMMLMIAALVFSQTVSADGSLVGVYKTSYELAEATYQQGADALNGKPAVVEPTNKEPISGTTFVEAEEKK